MGNWPAPAEPKSPGAPVGRWGGLRIGWIRAPEPVITRLASVKVAADLGSSQWEPALAAAPAREGCVARRRAAYYDQIQQRGTLRSRLALTGPDGIPVAA